MPTIKACRSAAPHQPHRYRATSWPKGKPRPTYQCPGAVGQSPVAAVRIRPEAFTDAALKSYGWASKRQAALACGVAPSTMRRVIAGQIAPGERLMAQLVASTGRSFDALFTVVTADRLEDALPGI